MRTDSINLAEVAVTRSAATSASASAATSCRRRPRVYKSRKGAQEAHEAIRPTSVDREPDSAGAAQPRRHDQRRLYTLIWQRAVACQMADAVLDSVSVDVDAAPPDRRRLPAARDGQRRTLPRLPPALRRGRRTAAEQR